jgi:DNA-binding response OmpR family regulator
MSAAGTSLDDRSVDVIGGRLRLEHTRTEQRSPAGLRAAGRLLVLLACDDDEASVLRDGWIGQSVDIEHRPDLGEVLYLAGRCTPDVIVVGTTGATGRAGADGAGLPVSDFLRILRQVDCRTPVVVGVPGLGGADELPAPIPAGATAVVPLPMTAHLVLRAVESCVGEGSAFRAQPIALDLGRLRLDGAGPRIWIDGVESVIPPMEFLLLRYLADRHGQFISRDELVSAAWGEPAAPHSNSLSVHIARLRRRFQRTAGEAWIRPVRGFGYQLTVSTRKTGRPTPRRTRVTVSGSQ